MTLICKINVQLLKNFTLKTECNVKLLGCTKLSVENLRQLKLVIFKTTENELFTSDFKVTYKVALRLTQM